MKSNRVVCVVGPTACGKTTLGVQIAQRFNGEVISCDSMQLYRGMEIGTAAPTMEERAGIVHHMIGIASPVEEYSVARYAEQADRCVQDCLSRGKLPVIVGGTGLYMDALVRGGTFAGGSQGGEVRRELYDRLSREGIEPLLDELRAVDSASAARLNVRDEKRILRALEVYRETGKTITEHNEESRALPPKYEATYIGLAFEDREDMKRRIDARVDAMVQAGLLDEVRALLASGVPRSATAMQAIGFKEFLAVADGETGTDEAIAEVKLRSRQYAKRQLTWLRRNKEIHWFFWKKERDFQQALLFSTKILSDAGVS